MTGKGIEAELQAAVASAAAGPSASLKDGALQLAR